MPIEKTLILLKPDAVQRAIAGEIVSRFEKKGLKIVGMKLINVSKELAHTHYSEHKEKPFFPGLVDFITAGPTLSLVVEGDNAIAVIRRLVGATNPQNADPGTIRHDFGMVTGRNLIHASDSAASATREIALFFKKDEIIEYELVHEKWVYE
ncbi:MAG: nucleoside-diphosphate kinase [Nanoarchaeota archaeon]|nr:nucleoside-diphosphate kinase [Nanoarchaeota archaeon]MBU4300385.1 nucleoside-diphosphate kinase [Nanoarchaeota archaeon]MBU4451337.1 nucleoside-diphosphate kinase [Nanoarchaeota archaeon]MCG2723740.1 nucleoside-diphosphate kinase [archaeon]